MISVVLVSLEWRHIKRQDVWNHQTIDYLFNILFILKEETSKIRIVNVMILSCVLSKHSGPCTSIVAKAQSLAVEFKSVGQPAILRLGHRPQFMRPLRSMYKESLGILENKPPTWEHTGINLNTSICKMFEAVPIRFCKQRRKCHFDDYFVIGWTGGWHFGNCWCIRWWKFHGNGDIYVLLKMTSFSWNDIL